MKKILIGVLVILGFSSCAQNIPGAPYFQDVDEVFEWVVENIEYTQDNEDIWQTPEQTYELRSGHCADMGLLEMYFLNEMGIESEMLWIVFVHSITGEAHALIRVEGEYAPRNSTSNAFVVQEYNGCVHYEIIKVTTYEESLELAIANRSIEYVKRE